MLCVWCHSASDASWFQDHGQGQSNEISVTKEVLASRFLFYQSLVSFFICFPVQLTVFPTLGRTMLAVTTSSPSLSKHTRSPVSSAFNHWKFKHVLDLQTHTPRTDHRRGRTVHLQGAISKSSHSGRRIKVSLDAEGEGRKRRERASEHVCGDSLAAHGR